MAYDYDPYYDDNFGGYQPMPPAPAPASAFPSASMAPPIYPGPAGSSYTDPNGQAQTVPTAPAGPNGPISTIDQPMWQNLWAQSGKNPQAFVQAVISQLGLKGRQTDPTALNTILRALQAVGVNATLDQRNDAYHKGIMLDGHFVKLLDGADNWTWGYDADKQGGGAGGAVAIDPSFLAPYTKEFGAPAEAALPNFQGPGAFRLPSADDILKNPAYQWEEGRIKDAVQNSASAAGTLNTSGTLDRIMGSVSDFARTNYNNIANRDFNIWSTDWAHALDAYDRQFGRSNTVYNRAQGEYDLGKRLFQENQDRPFSKLTYGVDLGSRAAAA